MSRLYPRLLPSAASRLFRELQDKGPNPPSLDELPSLADAVFAATGGTRVSATELVGVRRELLSRAVTAGFPGSTSRAGFNDFDNSAARYLHAMAGMTPGEASQRSVWSYFGLVLTPDICAWRYPANESRGYLDDRFLGSDLTRHTLAKLWLRAHLLHDPGSPDPYALISVLGEADTDQILTRRLDVAATPALVREVVRAYRDDAAALGGPNDRQILRDSLKRLMRMAAYRNLDSLTKEQLAELVRECRARSRKALAG